MAYLCDKYDIPADLVMNLDQTGVPFVPASDYQWVQKGAKEASANGYGDKRKITVTPTTTASGVSLPLQVCTAITSTVFTAISYFMATC